MCNALTPLPGSPFAAGSFPGSVAVDPSGRFAYVANGASDNVSGYTIDATTGALTSIPGSPFVAGDSPESVTVDPSGRFVYVANQLSSTVSGYTIDATTGALTAVGTVQTRVGPTFIALTRGTTPVTITPRFAYVANELSATISEYTINASSGALTPLPGSPFAAGTAPSRSVTVDPSRRFVYMANLDSANSFILGYTINASSGALTPLPGSPFTAGTNPISLTVDPSGRFAYVANFNSAISGYTIDATTGALMPLSGSPFAAGVGPTAVITSAIMQ